MYREFQKSFVIFKGVFQNLEKFSENQGTAVKFRTVMIAWKTFCQLWCSFVNFSEYIWTKKKICELSGLYENIWNVLRASEKLYDLQLSSVISKEDINSPDKLYKLQWISANLNEVLIFLRKLLQTLCMFCDFVSKFFELKLNFSKVLQASGYSQELYDNFVNLRKLLWTQERTPEKFYKV